jgi:ATP-dependent helicase HrpA
VQLPLKYRFAPGHPQDGLTLTVPLPLLNQLDAARLTWLVPGMIREKVAAYFRALPKGLRSRLVPVPEAVTAFLEASEGSRLPLNEAIRAHLHARLGVDLPAQAWDGFEVPAHLQMNVVVVDAAGRELGSGRDLGALKAALGEAAQLSFQQAGPAFEKRGLTSWTFGRLPETLTTTVGGRRITGYPALIDDGNSVSLALLDTAAAALAASRAGVLRLLSIALKAQLASLAPGGPGFAAAALQLKAVIPTDRLLADVMAAVRDRAFLGEDPLPRSEEGFAEAVHRARARLPAVAEGAFRLLAAIAVVHQALTQRLASQPPTQSRRVAELRQRRDALVYPGFFAATPWAQLAHLPRYLEALERRLAKCAENPARDARHAATMSAWWGRYRERLERNRAGGRVEPGLEAFRWLLEELSVSLFAQELKTPFPVSLKRVDRAWADLG